VYDDYIGGGDDDDDDDGSDDDDDDDDDDGVGGDGGSGGGSGGGGARTADRQGATWCASGGKHETSADRVTEKTEIFECRRRVGPRARAWRGAATGRPTDRPAGCHVWVDGSGVYRGRVAGGAENGVRVVEVTVRPPDDQHTAHLGTRGG